MKTVLIVGGGGFIGRHTIGRLLDAECYQVWATHATGRQPPPIAGVQWVPCNLACPTATAGWPAACDRVVFLAQSRHWRQFPHSADDVFAINLGALHQTVQYAIRSGARQFLVASTGSVYSGRRGEARETDPIDVAAERNFYVATKLAAEILLGPYSEMLPILQLRLFSPYGKGQNPKMLIPQLVRRVVDGRPIVLHEPDGLRTNPVAVSDVAEAILRCLWIDRSHILNVAGPEILTLREIGETLGRVLQKPTLFETIRAEPPQISGDVSNLRAVLDWSPTTRFEDGLKQWLGSRSSFPAVA